MNSYCSYIFIIDNRFFRVRRGYVMSILYKVKVYFGMVFMEDYDDEYYDDCVFLCGYVWF